MTGNDDPRRAVGLKWLGATAVTLFHRQSLLVRAVVDLREAGYHIARTDAAGWVTVRDMHRDLARLLDFPRHYGHNLDAFNDSFGDTDLWAGATGLVLVFDGYDVFGRSFPREAHALTDIIAVHSRGALLRGEQILCLLQSGDPRFELPPVGATPVMWNSDEWSWSARGI